MAVLSRLLLGAAERVDLADMLSIDGYTAADFQALIKTFAGTDKPYVLNGFEVINPSLAIGAVSLAIDIANAAVYYPQSNAGSFYYGFPEGSENAEPLVPELRQNATNFIYLTFTTFDNAKDTRAFWDVDQNGGEGGEFTQDINTSSTLKIEVGVSVASFPEGSIPICKVVVGTSVIQAIQDCRDMMFRLGTGGLIPDPFANFTFPSLPSAQYARNEPPSTITSAAQPNPFEGGDKNITTLKEWMNAVMTRIKEIGGTTYWYEAGGGGSSPTPPNINDLFQDFAGTAFSSKGRWEHSGATPGLVTYTEDMHITSLRDPRKTIIRANNFTLADKEIAWIDIVREGDLNPVLQTVNWTNGVNFVNGVVGAFADVKQGDWIKSKNDDVSAYARVEEFYQNTNLGGSAGVSPVLAQSVRLSTTYSGLTGTEFGERYQGEYIVSDIELSTSSDPNIQTAGGNFYWVAYRSDIALGLLSLTPTTLTVTIDQADGEKARVTSGAVHNLIDGDRVYISSGAFLGTYQVEVESTTIFYITTTVTGTSVGVSAFYAIVDTAAIDNGYGFELENADTGCRTNEHIVLDTGTAYDGNYQVNVRSTSSVQIAITANTGSIGPIDSPVFIVPRVSVRTELGPVNLVQGENANIGDLETDNILSFIGMESLAQTKPVYETPSASNMLDGEENYNSLEDDDLTARASRLTAMMADRVQERGMIFATRATIKSEQNGSNQDISSSVNILLKKPKSPDQTINLVTPIGLPVNSALIATINRNSSASIVPTVESIGTTTLLGENKIILAVRYSTTDVFWCDGALIPTNGKYTLSGPEDTQNKNINVWMQGGLKFAPLSGLVSFDMTRVKEKTQIIVGAGGTITAGSYFTLANANDVIKYYFWYEVDGLGTDPAVVGYTGIQVSILSTDTANQVATATAALLPGASFASSVLTNTITVTNIDYGSAEDCANGTPSPGFNISILAQGVDAWPYINIPGSANENEIDSTTINSLGTLILAPSQTAWVRISRTSAKVFNTIQTDLTIPDTTINGSIYITATSLVPIEQDCIALFTRVGDNLIRHHEATTPDANVYDETIDVIFGVPSNSYEVQGPLVTGTIINLPPDSRDGNSAQTYLVGAGQLEVYLNGQYLRAGVDWLENGVVDTESSSIITNQDLVIGDHIMLRIDGDGGVYFASAGGGGGGAPLQDCYDAGRFINTNSGQPIVISGPIGEKLLIIQGDLDVTGVIDPTGLQLTPQVTNPLSSGDKGIWVDNNNDLIYENGTTSLNVSDDFIKRDGSLAFTANQNAAGFQLDNLGTPTASAHAATKTYVDTKFVPRDGSVAFTANLNAGNFQIDNLGAPTTPTQAATKGYVDSTFYHLDGSLPLAGDMNAGGNQISNLGSPAVGSDAANKTYVDTNLSLFLKKDGSVAMTGDLNLSSHKLLNVTDPTDPQDAATKAYVDSIATPVGTYMYLTNGDVVTLNPGDVVIAHTVPQQMVRGDADSPTTAQSVLGIVDETVIVGAVGRVQITGERIVSTSATLVPGYPAYLSQTAGHTTPVVPTASGSAVMMVGVATATNKILINAQYRFKNEPSYEEPYAVVAPITSGDNITLPLNSRNGNAAEYYLVGKGALQLFLNGQKQKLGTDWNEVGTPGTDSNQITILQDLVVDDILIFRDATTSETLLGGGGGGPLALEDLTDVVITGVLDGDILSWNNTMSYWENVPNDMGIINAGQNLGGGAGQVYKSVTGDKIDFRTIVAGNELTVTTGTNTITIAKATTGAYYRQDIEQAAGRMVLQVNQYVMHTDTLELYRNGVRMFNMPPEAGSVVDKYMERTPKSITLLEGVGGAAIPDGTDIFTVVNKDEESEWSTVVTNQTGVTIALPTYTVGTGGLRVFRNGILMNDAGLGNPIDKYSETSSTLITLNQAATTSEHFLISYGPVPTSNSSLDGFTGTFISSVPTYNMGSDELLVYRNGVLMFNSLTLGLPVDRYTETSPTSITLSSTAVASDVFTFIVK